MRNPSDQAPGQPGIPPRWTSSAKTGIGTALNPSSRVWFTISHGIFDEIYYPRVDQACTRDMGMIVTDGVDFFSEEKRDAEHEVAYLQAGVPAYKLTNTCKQGRYRIEKEILSDPARDVVLQRTHFTALQGSLKDYHLYVLLSPHLGNQGADNSAWVGDYKGEPMLFANRNATALALACTLPWAGRSAGYAGASDGWQDLYQHKQMAWFYTAAPSGNVALTGEIDLTGEEGDEVCFTLALGFGRNTFEAGQRALASMLDGFETASVKYIQDWRHWQKEFPEIKIKGYKPGEINVFEISRAVMRTHEAKRFPGGLIASLSIPWGFSKGDADLGGYHLVWPRDLVEVAGGLLAAGAKQDVRRVLLYLQVTQEKDGYWPQNMWLDGQMYWSGIQMDETAFPILLVEMARREEALNADQLARLWPMVRQAAGFIVCNGPATPQDRWEEDSGFSPFTLAVEIAALLTAADLAENFGESAQAKYLRETADLWNDQIERWTYVRGTDIAQKHGVEGYYVRIAPPNQADSASPAQGFVPIKNKPVSESELPVTQIVSPDALALVRFGLRAPNDPRILNTIKVIDAELKVDTPSGPGWHRYNDDGYGEHEDGSPFDGTGIGRVWPLLTGERAHYELAAGNRKEAVRLLKTMDAFASQGGMLPEQIWDTQDIPERELYFGHPSGSAMPLVWAHAEYAKLCHSLQDGQIFDLPDQTSQRYLAQDTHSTLTSWRFKQQSRLLAIGTTLRIEVLQPARIHWSQDNWQTIEDTTTIDSGLGIYYADLPTKQLDHGTEIKFTFYWPGEDLWEGQDFLVEVD